MGLDDKDGYPFSGYSEGVSFTHRQAKVPTTPVTYVELVPNTFWSTRAGNTVYKVISPAERPVNAFQSEGTTFWNAVVLLDTGSYLDDKVSPLKRHFGQNVVIENVGNLVPFDALSLGLLWEQVRQLSEETQRTWKQET